jgi:hypothetical protein
MYRRSRSPLKTIEALIVAEAPAKGGDIGMRKLLSRPLLWGTAATVSLVLHAWWVWSTHDGGQAARCGATWVVFAGAIIARPIIRMGYGAWYQSSKIIDSGHFKPTPEEHEENRQSAIDARCVQLFGPVLAVLGTILWAYGDLAANAVIKSR